MDEAAFKQLIRAAVGPTRQRARKKVRAARSNAGNGATIPGLARDHCRLRVWRRHRGPGGPRDSRPGARRYGLRPALRFEAGATVLIKISRHWTADVTLLAPAYKKPEFPRSTNALGPCSQILNLAGEIASRSSLFRRARSRGKQKSPPFIDGRRRICSKKRQENSEMQVRCESWLTTICALAACCFSLAGASRTAAQQAAAPAPAVSLQPYTAPDKSATAGVPAGWKVTKGAFGVIQMSGPQGEAISLGNGLFVMNGPFKLGQMANGPIQMTMLLPGPARAKVRHGLAAGLRPGRRPDRTGSVVSATPIALGNVAQCGIFLGKLTNKQGASNFETRFCALPMDTNGVFKLFWMNASIPVALAAGAATAEAVSELQTVSGFIEGLLKPSDAADGSAKRAQNARRWWRRWYAQHNVRGNNGGPDQHVHGSGCDPRSTGAAIALLLQLKMTGRTPAYSSHLRVHSGVRADAIFLGRNIQGALHLAQRVCLVGSGESGCNAEALGTARSSHAMHIILCFLRHVEVDHMRDVGNIDAPGRNVGSYQDTVLILRQSCAGRQCAATASDRRESGWPNARHGTIASPRDQRRAWCAQKPGNCHCPHRADAPAILVSCQPEPRKICSFTFGEGLSTEPISMRTGFLR